MESIKRSILGMATLVAMQGAYAQDVVALNTWFSATHGDHFTTSDPRWAGTRGEVRAAGGGSGYVFLRQEGRVYSPARPQPRGTVPLFSYFNAALGDNFITSDPRWTEGRPAAGYTRVRLEGYVHPRCLPGMAALRSYFSPGRADNYASTDPRLPLVLGSDAGENTRSVEGGRYHHYRVEGYMLPSFEPAPAPRTVMWGLADMHRDIGTVENRYARVGLSGGRRRAVWHAARIRQRLEQPRQECGQASRPGQCAHDVQRG